MQANNKDWGRREFRECITANIKTNNNKWSKYLRSRKPVRKLIGSLEDKEAKGMLKEEKENAEKLDFFFASVWTAEDVG